METLKETFKVAEILNGELLVSARPSTRDAVAVANLLSDLAPETSRWRFVYAAEVHLGQDVLVPALVGWLRTQMPRVPDAPFFELAPDWVCELNGPGRRPLNRVRKLPLYAREKVEHVWLLDPVSKLLEVFRRKEAYWVVVAAYEGDAKVRAPPFEAIELDLSRFWLETS